MSLIQTGVTVGRDQGFPVGPSAPHNLADHRCLRWRGRGNPGPYAWEFCKDGRWFSVAVDGSLIADRREMCVQAAVNGAGIAFAVEAIVAARIASGALVPLLRDWSAPFPGFFLGHARQHLLRSPFRVLIDTITAGKVG